MKHVIFFLYISVFVLITVSAKAGENELAALLIAAQFSQEQAARVQGIVMGASEKGITADILIAKIHEGIAKRVPPAKVLLALERVAARYDFSYALAAEFTNDKNKISELGRAIVEGITAGMTHEDMKRLAVRLNVESVQRSAKDLYGLQNESILTARDMARQGVSSQTAVEVIERAVLAGDGADGIRSLRSSFNRESGHGNGESLARGYGQALEQGVGPKDLSAHIGGGGPGRQGAGIGQGGQSGGGGGGGGNR